MNIDVVNEIFKRRPARDFLRLYPSEKWKEIIPDVFEIGVLNLKNSFGTLKFTKIDLKNILVELRNYNPSDDNNDMYQEEEINQNIDENNNKNNNNNYNNNFNNKDNNKKNNNNNYKYNKNNINNNNNNNYDDNININNNNKDIDDNENNNNDDNNDD